jgi:regulator of protease activity HflC (stomatin/prohibitin superfamily)
MRRASPIPFLIFLILAGLSAVVAWLIAAMAGATPAIVVGAIALVAAALIAATIQIANQWERAIVLRLGRFQAMRGPGMFFIIPVVDVIPYWIDTRVMTSTFKAEKTLTKDTVPVDVDAVLFWKVVDPQKAAIDVEDFVSAISWASQTALRDVIGKTMLSDMLEGREKIGQALRHIIDERSQPWGVNVISVEGTMTIVELCLRPS